MSPLCVTMKNTFCLFLAPLRAHTYHEKRVLASKKLVKSLLLNEAVGFLILKKRMKVNLNLLKCYDEDKHAAVIAMALFIKVKYENSCVYNYKKGYNTKTNTYIWNDLKICKKTYLKYVNILVENNHARIHHKNLTIESLYSRKNEFIEISRKQFKLAKSNKEAVCLMLGHITRHNAAKQKRSYELKLRANKVMAPKNSKEFKAAKSAKNLLLKQGIEINAETQLFNADPNVRFSINTLVLMLGVSRRKVYQMINFLKKNQLLKVKRDIVWLENVKKQPYSCKLSQNTFTSKAGWTYLINSNIYSFSPSLSLK